MAIKRLYKSLGVLWQPVRNIEGTIILTITPRCPNETCHAFLESVSNHWVCRLCVSKYPYKFSPSDDHKIATKKFRGYQTLDWEVQSLDLPPTKVSAGDDDDNYWVKVKLGEKNGKRMAVIYLGEKIRGKQDKTDYSQLFIDLEDEQIRFDRNNKNPMKILSKLAVEFQDSVIEQKKLSK